MTRTKLPKYAASDVFRALEKRYEQKAYALFAEVGNSTGFGCSRHADAIAMSLWPSRGLHIEGIEIKVSRADWLKELALPEKSDPIQGYCDFWWIAVGNAEIVQPGELPPTWGLLELKGEKLAVKVAAPKLDPKPLDRKFVAALLRRAAEGVDARVRTARSEGLQQGRAEGPEGHKHALQRIESAKESVERSVREFEEASGVKIDHWNAGRIGAAVRTVLELNRYTDFDAIEEAERIRQYIGQRADELKHQIDAMRKARKAAGRALAVGNAGSDSEAAQ